MPNKTEAQTVPIAIAARMSPSYGNTATHNAADLTDITTLYTAHKQDKRHKHTNKLHTNV